MKYDVDKQVAIKEKRRRKRIRKIIFRASLLIVCVVAILWLVVYLLVAFFKSVFSGDDKELEKVNGTTKIIEEVVEENVLSVCIDAGHGGKDAGAILEDRYEKNDNLKIAMELKKYLESKDIKVIMTRENDVFMELTTRCDVANRHGADYLISLHRNTGDGYGVEIWLKNNASEENVFLAETTISYLFNAGVSRNRGVSYGTAKNPEKNYRINENSKVPSMIVELGFLNSEEDNKLFDKNFKRYAEAIGDAIIKTYDQFGEGNNTEKIE